MVKVNKLKGGGFEIDGLPYDKVTTSIKAGILTVKASKIQLPKGNRVNSTIVTSSFAVFEEK